MAVLRRAAPPCPWRSCDLWAHDRPLGRVAADCVDPQHTTGKKQQVLTCAFARGAHLQEELLLWRDPKKSGIALAACTAVFAVLQFAKVNFIQTAAYALLIVVLGCFLWNNLATVMKK